LASRDDTGGWVVGYQLSVVSCRLPGFPGFQVAVVDIWQPATGNPATNPEN
jgi:hypothetical protein